MDIEVNNLDLGYEQCASLHSIVTSTGKNTITGENTITGVYVLNNLAENIGNLEIHWIGSDATEHINNLKKVYKALGILLSEAKVISAETAEKIIAIQSVRNANSGSGSVGDSLDRSSIDIQAMNDSEPTEKYYVDPAAASDYTSLSQICTDYETFINNFKNIKSELFENWLAGSNRERAVTAFNEFESNEAEYKKYLTNARDELGVAVGNIKQI